MVPVMATASVERPASCTLAFDAVPTRLGEWAGLRGWGQRVEVTADGARLWFDPAAAGPLGAVVAKEARCCSFLRLGMVLEPASVRLEITSEDSDAGPVIAVLVALAGGPVSDLVDP
jgi:hypothetical protein